MQLSTKQFTSDPKRKMLIAEASDLGRNYLIQVWPDACDVGIEIVSQNTGRHSRWVQTEEKRSNDLDNELLCTIYEPTRETLRTEPQLKGWTVHILND